VHISERAGNHYTIGIDVGMNTFHLVGLDKRGAIVLQQKVTRLQLGCRLNNIPRCPLKSQCTPAPLRRITRSEHEHVLEVVQQRLDKNPQAMRLRRETAEHPFATLKMQMGATHFLMKRLPKVATEMALHVLAYNLTRVMNIIGVQPLLAAMRA
jgi:hypothetical protein